MPIEKVKVNKLLLKILQLSVFVGAIYFVTTKLSEVTWNNDVISALESLFSVTGVLIILSVFIFQFINWTLEAFKFKEILMLFTNVDTGCAIKSVYIGNAFGLLTPDRLGTFVGRGMYFKKEKMTSILAATMIGNLAQLITTLLFGAIGLLILLIFDFEMLDKVSKWAPIVLVLSVLGIVFLMMLLFNFNVFNRIATRIKYLSKIKDQLAYLKDLTKLHVLKVLGYSLLRYAVFTSQLYLVFFLFKIDIDLIEFISFVGLLYLITTFIPSLFMGNLGTREAVALFLLSSYDGSALVVIALLIIWAINVAFPAVLGSILLIHKRST